MVRAVEHMAAERLNIEIPDYTPTLEKTNAWLAAIIKRLKAIEDAPALDMTPEDMGARIDAAARNARETDRANVQQAQQNQAGAVQALHQIIGHARTRQSQREHLLWGIGGGVLAGCLLRSEEHTSELQSLMRISYAVFCLKKKTKTGEHTQKIRNRHDP